MRTLFYLCLVVTASSCNVFSEPATTGLSKDITNAIPEWLIEQLQSENMIHEGKRPPNIEGSYLLSPHTLVKTYNDDTKDIRPGNIFNALSYTFHGQSSKNQKISLTYYDEAADETGEAKNGYVSGNGNYFTVFANSTGKSEGISYGAIFIVSGEITPTGIKNLRESITITYKLLDFNNKLMSKGATRIFKDGDGFSEKYSGRFRINADKEKMNASLLCTICTNNSNN
ncbi:hypothetical protein [Leadbetterella sp. DM7]|uniref:hypothetical protein n=1 Tax=Leadbetterella sp. DM7 TaxID=3235085 RepID=UPI00349EF75C